jgi:hypothetical protein
MTLKSLAAVCTTLTLAIGATVYLAAQDAQAEKTLIANERAVNRRSPRETSPPSSSMSRPRAGRWTGCPAAYRSRTSSSCFRR